MSNNPLRQYFRRPAIYFKLPSGGDYPPEVVVLPENQELPVYPMTAIDDISAKTPDALFNGIAMVDIIKSCIPAIKDPWKLNSIDIDSVLIVIKTAAVGNELELESTCPSCDTTSNYGINLIGLMSSLKSGDYTTELKLNDLIIKFKPLTFRHMTDASIGQFEVQKMFADIVKLEDSDEKSKRSHEALKKITQLTMKVLANSIQYIKIPDSYVGEYEFILEFMQNCDKETYEKIKEYSSKLKADSEIKPINIKCINCSHEYQQPFSLNISDFFG